VEQGSNSGRTKAKAVRSFLEYQSGHRKGRMKGWGAATESDPSVQVSTIDTVAPPRSLFRISQVWCFWQLIPASLHLLAEKSCRNKHHVPSIAETCIQLRANPGEAKVWPLPSIQDASEVSRLLRKTDRSAFATTIQPLICSILLSSLLYSGVTKSSYQ
jgi:hypothetical protein